MKRPVPMMIKRSAVQIGEHIASWRKLHVMSAQELADRAGISRTTLFRLEKGDPSVGLEAFLSVCRVIGVLDNLVDSIDPYESDLGRVRADWSLPQRVRSKR